MKPTSSFKLSKTTKRCLALGRFTSQEQRNGWKRAMIQAELAAAIQPRTKKGERND